MLAACLPHTTCLPTALSAQCSAVSVPAGNQSMPYCSSTARCLHCRHRLTQILSDNRCVVCGEQQADNAMLASSCHALAKVKLIKMLKHFSVAQRHLQQI